MSSLLHAPQRYAPPFLADPVWTRSRILQQKLNLRNKICALRRTPATTNWLHGERGEEGAVPKLARGGNPSPRGLEGPDPPDAQRLAPAQTV